MANVLSLVWYKVLPARFGGQKGIARFSQYLGQHQKLYFLCSYNNVSKGDETFEVMNELPDSKWQFINPSVKKKISHFVNKYGITHLILEHCYHGFFGLQLARKHKLKLIVHSHNIEYQRFRELRKWWWPLLYIIEKKTHRSADLSLFKTRDDLDAAVKEFNLDPEKCMIVPYGIERVSEPDHTEKEQCRKILKQRHGISPDTRIIYFNGTLDYEPNALALKHILNDIVPKIENKTRDHFIVLVTGRIIYKEYEYLRQLTHSHYLYAGFVEDIDTYFTGADIFINPLIHGGGVKVKLVEALSFGLPVISYTSGALGVDHGTTANKLVIIKDSDSEAFAEAVIANWENKSKLPLEFFSRYSWTAISREVSQRISQL